MTPQRWEKAGALFEQLCQTIAALRHPVSGCPWDLEQTHETLRKYMIEEAYEAAEVMNPKQPEKLKDELGDVLLQIVLNSQIALDNKTFSIADVIANLDAKMKRRHPHVFGNAAEGSIANKEDIRNNWEQIKAKEKSSEVKVEGIFSSIRPGTVTPAAAQSVAIGKLARKINFDWPNPIAVLEQVKSEISELEVEMKTAGAKQKEKIYEELGDVMFSLANLSRHLEIDPEVCAMDGNRKFLKRFAALEVLAKSEGINPTCAPLAELERLWLKAKELEKAAAPLT